MLLLYLSIFFLEMLSCSRESKPTINYIFCTDNSGKKQNSYKTVSLCLSFFLSLPLSSWLLLLLPLSLLSSLPLFLLCTTLPTPPYYTNSTNPNHVKSKPHIYTRVAEDGKRKPHKLAGWFHGQLMSSNLGEPLGAMSQSY